MMKTDDLKNYADLEQLYKFAVKSRDLYLWYRSTEFDFKKYAWVNEAFAKKIGLEQNENGLIESSKYLELVVKDAEGLRFIEHSSNIKDLIHSKEHLQSASYILKIKNATTKEVFYFEFIVGIFEYDSQGSVKSWGGNGIDITQSYLTQKATETMAYVDMLTGVNNRNHLEHFLNYNLWDSYSVIIFDINNLKQINDTYGHLHGDKLIVQLANLLKNSFSSNSTIVRLGGDEFLVLTNILKEEEILDKTNQINKELQLLNDSIKNYGVAYGHQTTINHELTYKETFQMADKKMYLHKNCKES